MNKDCLPLYTKMKRMPNELDLLVEHLLDMEDNEFEEYTEKLRLYLLDCYEKHKFPACAIRGRTLDRIIDDFRKFNTLEFSNIYGIADDKTKIIKCFDKSFSGVNHWFPEMYDVKRASSGQSVIDPFRNKEVFHRNFKRLIKKDALNFKKNNRLVTVTETLNGFRILNGVIPLSNFPSGVAKFLYTNVLKKKKFSSQSDLYVLDQSMGWGGRLIGILSATTQGLFGDKIIHYHGTDVNTSTHNRFNKIIEFWTEKVSDNNIQNFDFYKSLSPAEEMIEKDSFFAERQGLYDMAFTSPPYFNTEQYSDDDTQSFKRYSAYTDWSKGFLQNLIKTTEKLLKPGGEFWINIADVKKLGKDKGYYTLEDDTKKYAEENNFTYKGVIKMVLTTISGNGTTPKSRNRVIGKNVVSVDGQTVKYEPIFCFTKKN